MMLRPPHIHNCKMYKAFASGCALFRVPFGICRVYFLLTPCHHCGQGHSFTVYLQKGYTSPDHFTGPKIFASLSGHFESINVELGRRTYCASRIAGPSRS